MTAAAWLRKIRFDGFDALFLVGIGLQSYGAWLFLPAAGFAVGGLELCIYSILAGASTRRRGGG